MSACASQLPPYIKPAASLTPAFLRKLQHLSLPLSPLVQVTTGRVHPSFPRLLVNFWLLTDEELDDLSHFYHQRFPSRWTREYPLPVGWEEDMTTERKRRRFGRFIGLRGCESPVAEKAAAGEEWGVTSPWDVVYDEEVASKMKWYY